MKILIDADGCPVVKLTCQEAEKHNVECKIICDTSHEFYINGIETITVSKGKDSVDFKLVNMIEKNDIVVTQDYGLAAMCLAKGAKVINQNGVIYDEDNIMSMLNSRHISMKLRNSGIRQKGPEKRDIRYNDIFIKNLKFLIEIKNKI